MKLHERGLAMSKILIVEDEESIADIEKDYLELNGYEVEVCNDGTSGLAAALHEDIDMCILDIMLPGTDGFTFTKLLRDCKNDIPILMHTAKQLPDDIKTGFLAGADDYMTKPADEDVLLLRIKALLRRAKITAEHQLRIGHTTLNYDALTVTTDKDTQLLPQKEFLLLYKLLSYPNQIFTRMQLMDDIWGPDSDSGDATVSVHINRLRNRFQNCHDFSITTIRGLGYKAQVQEALM